MAIGKKDKAQLAMQKAAHAVQAATEALNQASSALAEMQALDMEDLDQVTGGSAWDRVPTVISHDYPVDPNNPNP